MALPYDNDVDLESLQTAWYELYDKDDVPEQYSRASTLMTLFSPDTKVFVGNGENWDCETAPADMVRWGTNPLPDSLGDPDNFQVARFKVGWDTDTPSNHHFTMFRAAIQVRHYDLMNKSAGAIYELAVRLRKQHDADYTKKFSMWNMSGSTGGQSLVNGTPKGNTRETYADASATVNTTNGVRVQVDSGSISNFLPGERYDFINPSTGAVRAGNLRCTDKNTGDQSVGFEWGVAGTAHPTRVSTGDITTIADNDIIALSGTYGASNPSLRSWLSSPTAGESFFGKDRTVAANRYLLPTTVPAVSSGTAKISQSHFDTVAQAAADNFDTKLTGLVVFISNRNATRLRNEIGQQNFITQPPTKSMEKRFAHFGWTGLIYQHPSLGLISINAEQLMIPTEAWFLSPKTWYTGVYGKKAPEMLPGTTSDMWSRLPAGAPNSGHGLSYRAESIHNRVTLCKRPFENLRLTAIDPA